jgi:hypothetical protein
LLAFLCLVAAAGWVYILYTQNRANNPLEIVRKHFVFYPDYSRGVWREEKCSQAGRAKCQEVVYTVALKGCGPLTFDWRVFPAEDAETIWSFQCTSPKLDESRYPLYAVLNEDSHLIDSPTRGKPLTCQLK